MDRQAFTVGQLVPNPQILGMEKAKLVGLGYALEAVMGAGGTVVSGLACAPTAPSSLSVVVGRGSIMTTGAIDSVAYSDLGTDTNATIKQGILQEPGVTLALTAPSTPGYAQVYLIQAKQSDVDSATTVPFYNAANPAQPYNGPNNSGNATLTLRQSACIVSLKAGAAATSGSQVAPAPDLGNVGLYTITLLNGQSTITAGQIVQLPSAPFITTPLPQVPSVSQSGKWVFATATGTNAYSVAFTPALTARTVGMEVLVYFPSANTATATTLNDGLGAAPLVKMTGGLPASGDMAGFVPLVWDGANYRANGPLASDINIALNYLGQIDLLSNGAMEVSQINGTNAVANANGYVLDNVQVLKAGSMAVSAQQVSDAPAGYSKSLQVNITTAASVLGASDYLLVSLPIEGVDLARLNFGTNAAAPLSIGFWFKSSIAGTFCVAPQNFAAARSYLASFSYPTAGTWQWVPLPGIPGDLAGTWVSGAAGAMKVNIVLAAGANFQGTAGAWAAGNFLSAAGQSNGAATSGVSFQVAGATVLPGAILPPAANAYQVRRTYQQEYDRCLRYLESGIGGMAGAVPGFTSYAGYKHAFKKTKRVVPTILTYGFDGANCTAYNPGQQATWGTLPTTYTSGTVEVDGIYVKANLNTANTSWAFYLYWTVDARM